MASRRRNDFESFSLIGLLTKPFRAVGEWIAESMGATDNIRSEQSLIGSIFSVLLLPLNLIWASGLFMINSWTVSRRGWAFVIGVPAILAIGGFLSSLWVADYLRQSRGINSSRAYFTKFRTDELYGPKIAKIFAQKLVELEPNNLDAKYQLGEVLQEAGELERALDIMTFLAPEDRPGYVDAHVWLGRYFALPSTKLADEIKDEKVQKHFGHAIELVPDHSFALFSIAELHEVKANDFPKDSPEHKAELTIAVNYLKKLLDNMSSSSIPINTIPKLIQHLISLDQKPEAVQRMNAIIKKVMPMLRREPDNPEYWRMMIAGCALVGDYDQANAIMDEAYQLVKRPEVAEQIEQLASLLILEQANSFSDMKDREQFLKRLNLLSFAVTKHPNNRVAYQKLLGFIDKKANPDVNESWLQESLIGCPNPGVVHILLGIAKITQGDVLAGQRHWRIAEQQFPTTQVVINNLINVAIIDFPENFENMLDVVSLAVELFPNQPLLYQTRGLYYKRMKRFPEAIVDLETAVKDLPLELSLIKLLGDCYEQVGNEDRVTYCRHKTQEILDNLNPQDRQKAELYLEKIN